MISDDAFARTCPSEGERKATIRLELATSHATRENIIANFANRAANRNVEFPTSVANITKEEAQKWTLFYATPVLESFAFTMEKYALEREILSSQPSETTLLGSS